MGRKFIGYSLGILCVCMMMFAMKEPGDNSQPPPSLPISLPPPAAHFDYFLLVQTWFPSYKRVSPSWNRAIRNGFYPHGMWPSNYHGRHPRGPGVTDQEFNSVDMTLVYNRLTQQWPNLRTSYSAKEHYSWKYQWGHHGVVSGMAQVDYFDLALNLFMEHPLLAMLEARNIRPDNRVQLQVSEILAAIIDAVGSSPLITCTSTNTFGFILYEIGLCFKIDVSGNPVYENCPASNTCPPLCYFPIFMIFSYLSHIPVTILNEN